MDVICNFYDICKSAEIDCEFCYHNANRYIIDNFEWNGAGEEPTLEELEEDLLGLGCHEEFN